MTKAVLAKEGYRRNLPNIDQALLGPCTQGTFTKKSFYTIRSLLVGVGRTYLPFFCPRAFPDSRLNNFGLHLAIPFLTKHLPTGKRFKMLIPKADRKKIHESLFREGVLVAPKKYVNEPHSDLKRTRFATNPTTTADAHIV